MQKVSIGSKLIKNEPLKGTTDYWGMIRMTYSKIKTGQENWVPKFHPQA